METVIESMAEPMMKKHRFSNQSILIKHPLNPSFFPGLPRVMAMAISEQTGYFYGIIDSVMVNGWLFPPVWEIHR